MPKQKHFPVFIVGSDRSGTTLLRLMLTCHPQIAIPPESLFIILLYPKWGQQVLSTKEQINQFCEDLYQEVKFQEWGLDRCALEVLLIPSLPLEFPQAVDIIYKEFIRTNQPSAKYWGDKNPSNAKHLDIIWKLFPQASVIHLIRDGRAVFNSFITANQRAKKRFWPETPARAASSWIWRLNAAQKFRFDKRYFEVFYENLVRYPEKELVRICNFLNVPYSPEMLDYYRRNQQHSLVPQKRLAYHNKTLKPLQTQEIDNWKTSLSPADVRQFEFCAGYHLARNGYPPDICYLFRLRFVTGRSLIFVALFQI